MLASTRNGHGARVVDHWEIISRHTPLVTLGPALEWPGSCLYTDVAASMRATFFAWCLGVAATVLCSTVLAAGNTANTGSFWTQKSLVKGVELAGSVSALSLEAVVVPTASIEKETGEDVPYLLYLSEEEHNALSSLVVVAEPATGAPAGSATARFEWPKSIGQIEGVNKTAMYALGIPRDLMNGVEPITFKAMARLVHSTRPLPASIDQGEQQLLLYEGDAGVRTPYETGSSVVHVKCPTNNIVSTSPKSSRSGTSVTFGPYTNVAPWTAASTAPLARVHYGYNRPLITFVDFERHVEVSHWGDNMATEDRIWMRNDGAKLNGHFVRSKHMLDKFMEQPDSFMLESTVLQLPQGVQGVYFVDDIGNVSTSALRAEPSGSTRPSRLEVTPRFPLAGGWNYTFMLGWNQRLSENGIAQRVPAQGPNRVRITVPFLPGMRSTAVDHARLRVVLPEGAKQISVYPAFEMDSVTTSTHTSYLDTTGRPAVVLERAKCTALHAQPVYVEYTISPLDHLRKPIAVTVAALCVFVLSAVMRRLKLGVPAERTTKT